LKTGAGVGSGVGAGVGVSGVCLLAACGVLDLARWRAVNRAQRCEGRPVAVLLEFVFSRRPRTAGRSVCLSAVRGVSRRGPLDLARWRAVTARWVLKGVRRAVEAQTALHLGEVRFDARVASGRSLSRRDRLNAAAVVSGPARVPRTRLCTFACSVCLSVCLLVDSWLRPQSLCGFCRSHLCLCAGRSTLSAALRRRLGGRIARARPRTNPHVTQNRQSLPKTGFDAF
jgi:hypothetical protein